MEKDPLSFFLNEKTAADSAADTPLVPEEPRAFTKNPDPESIDPGERAMAGIIAVGGSTIGGMGQFLGQTILRSAMFADATGVARQMQAGPVGHLRDLGSHRPPGGRVLKLFDIKARMSKVPDAAYADMHHMARTGDIAKHRVAEAVAKQDHTLKDITKTVDSFIDKHNLAKKGVTINLKQGPLNWMLGPRYELAKKRVYLPEISKNLALHELGHAADYTKGRIGKVRGTLEPILRRGAQIALPAALIAGDQIKELLPGTVDDKAIEFMQRHAPAIAGATIAATTLYPEAKASYLALKHIAKTEGRDAAMKSLKMLGAGWGTYVLGAIPTIVGLSLARKYMREARKEKGETDDLVQQQLRELEKTSGIMSNLVKGFNPKDLIEQAARGVRSSAKDFVYVGEQVAQQSRQMIRNKEVISRVTGAAKAVGTDPTFVQGALISAVPATMASLYLYGTPAGKHIRERMHPAHVRKTQSGSEEGLALVHSKTDEKWREENPLKFAGLVAAGAAMSGGVMAKLFSDLAKIL
jgi:hypothetical protein